MVTYAGKLVLAPMVRAGELPTRLLALKFGADLVWSPEIIDKKLIQCKRVENQSLRTVDFVLPGPSEKKPSSTVFRTFPDAEAGKVIFQLGSSTPDLAVQAALVVIKDVDGIDLNAGCPKHFSIHSGMGAALLQKPDNLCSILKSLVEQVGKPHQKPISVKIRLLEDEALTVQLVKLLCGTGISNLTVHCRTTPMRNRQAPIRDYIPAVYKVCQENNVSLILNGAIQSRTHFLELREQMGISDQIGGMMADCAEGNPTVFSKTPLPWFETVKAYLAIASQFDHNVNNAKYMLTRIVPGKSKFYQYFTRCKSMAELEYVAKLLDDKGQPLADPIEYLENCRQQEKLAKQRAGDIKSQLHRAKSKTPGAAENAECERKRAVESDGNTDNKKFKTA
ncbi:LANO_0A02212g1_1 [Lachancea nothofagi CBS 11611]|uniref:tRNA-dihydrouridine(20) synthase [NAD(P)+] n=1 Tax=Lachancea nothofagi CBS 11611 TaxID=1266666 RepID=A0A1G4INA8_9SACH|nr:LANO_0A02212g1_1 [Lachancea nothofagi CBS 11611]